MIQIWTWFCTVTIQSINPRTSAVPLSHYHSLLSICLNFIPSSCLCNSLSDHTVHFNLIQAVNHLFSVPSGNMQIIQGTLLGVQKMRWTKEGGKKAGGLSIKSTKYAKIHSFVQHSPWYQCFLLSENHYKYCRKETNYFGLTDTCIPEKLVLDIDRLVFSCNSFKQKNLVV